ncbi:MAG: MBL fold metallo-hydrolase [Acidimicrobiia bacterium]|nr:MBL fold metallo-hydrolase [Acidimicrobiia bacterium]MDH3462066.1 MBL fold metallo-hydrolase [Acidimicrobiia bacterium]
MRVSVVGSSGTFPTRTNPASGYLIEHGGTRIWCDTGPGTFTALPCDPSLVEAVFISHRHPDHCSDLFAAYHAWTFVPEPRKAIPLLANGDVLDHLSAFSGDSRSTAFGDTFELIEVADRATHTVGAVDIEFVEVEHSVPAIGTRWTGDGRTLFYTGDTGPGEWSQQIGPVDVLLSEAALQGQRTDADFIHHLNAYEAGEIARAARVGRLVLTHIPPYLDSSISVAQAELTFGKPVGLAVAGMQIPV